MATPPDPTPILDLSRGFMASKTLLSAVEVGLFSTLAELGPSTADELRNRLGLHRRSVRDFFDALVSLQLLQRDDQKRYTNSPAADFFLDRAKPTYIGGLLEMQNSRLYGFWGSLTEALRTGKPQNEAKHGGGLFDALYADLARLETFLQAMTGMTLLTARPIVEKFPWPDYKTFVDVGAAQGCLAVQVAKAHAHLTGGGYDLPPVRPVFERYVHSNGLADRLAFHPGNFFADPLPCADVLIMGRILHDWDLDEKKELLSKAYDALPSGGALLVYEMIIDDERRSNTQGLLMSLNMLIETPGGFDFTGADCTGWMTEVGFHEARVEPLAGPHSMVIGIK